MYNEPISFTYGAHTNVTLRCKILNFKGCDMKKMGRTHVHQHEIHKYHTSRQPLTFPS